MQRNDSQIAQNAHRRVQASTTLNRRYVKRPTRSAEVPVSISRSSKISHFNTQMPQVDSTKETIQPAKAHPLQNSANAMVRARKMVVQPQTHKVSAKELKDQAIRRALAVAAKDEQIEAKQMQKVKKEKVGKIHFGFGRVMLALGCTAIAVFAIVYFVNLNMPDVSLKVAAMQTGINASYPSYVPRDFAVSSITSEKGEVTISFYNSKTDASFDLIEEKSYWDSSALLTNYVKDKYEDNYTAVREQGITLYISESDAAWVNGGVVYKIITKSGSLTNKQIRSIAVSL